MRWFQMFRSVGLLQSDNVTTPYSTTGSQEGVDGTHTVNGFDSYCSNVERDAKAAKNTPLTAIG